MNLWHMPWSDPLGLYPLDSMTQTLFRREYVLESKEWAAMAGSGGGIV